MLKCMFTAQFCCWLSIPYQSNSRSICFLLNIIEKNISFSIKVVVFRLKIPWQLKDIVAYLSKRKKESDTGKKKKRTISILIVFVYSLCPKTRTGHQTRTPYTIQYQCDNRRHFKQKLTWSLNMNWNSNRNHFLYQRKLWIPKIPTPFDCWLHIV